MDATARQTNALERTAKSCGPDPPMPGSSFLRDAFRERRRWPEARRTEETTYKP